MWLHAEVKTLGDIPRHYRKHSGHNPALILGSSVRSFEDLDRAANRIANGIIQRVDGIGERIAFIGRNSIPYFEILFGAAKAGCSIVPLNWRLSPLELAQVIEDARPALIFVDREFVDSVRALKESCAWQFGEVVFDTASDSETDYARWLTQYPDEDPQLNVRPESTAVILYTSGTTGKPKGVQLSHEGLNYWRLSEHLDPAFVWQEKDVMMLVMPIFHLVGTGLSLQGLYNGVPVTILPAMDAGKLIEVIARDRPSICCLVPTAIQMILDHPAARNADFSSLRLVMYAGSPIGSELLKRAMREMKCRFMQFYGGTESCAVALLRPDQHDADSEQKLKSCGTPPPLVDIKIVDQSFQELSCGEVGELAVRSPMLFTGYWNQPETTAAAMHEGWFRTGDAAYKDADGLYYIVDRIKDMIISGGENIYSVEVEQALLKHPSVIQVAVIGVPDERWGEKVTAFVVTSGDSAVDEASLIEHCRKLIAGYKVPKTINLVTALPMTATGKIMKRSLRQ